MKLKKVSVEVAVFESLAKVTLRCCDSAAVEP